MTPKFLKSGLVPLCLLALCGVANAAEHQPWYGAPDCRIAPVDKPPIDEVRWRGPCKDGYAEGRGVLEWRDDKHVRYALEGALVRGEIAGEATLKGEHGFNYVGTFAHGMAHGRGYLRQPQGQYEGEIVNGKPEGVGIYLAADGDRYEGQWKNGKHDGNGRMSYALGGSYDGEWKEGKRHGHGVLVYAGSGRRYEGQFADDAIAGTPPQPPLPTDASYSLSIDEIHAGTHLKDTIALGSQVPLDRSYDQLTPEQRRMVNARYPALEQGDEPPYPLHGMETFFTLVSKATSRYETSGLLMVQVLVGADGRAVSVTTKGLEGQPMGDKMRHLAAVAAMSLDYKPARCQGKPCDMLFPLHMQLGQEL